MTSGWWRRTARLFFNKDRGHHHQHHHRRHIFPIASSSVCCGVAIAAYVYHTTTHVTYADTSPPSPPPPAVAALYDQEDEEDTPSPEFHAPFKAGDSDVYVVPSSQSKLKIFSPNSRYALATEVALLCGTQLGRAKVRAYADGEIDVQVLDNVRGEDVFVIHPTCPPNINDRLMELVLMVTTLKRSSAARVTAVIPYYGYGRQCVAGGQSADGEAIAAADVARMLEWAGVDQVVSVDLHEGQIQGFFSSRVPVENLDPTAAAVPYFMSKHLHDPVIIYPGNHAIFRAKRFQKHLRRHGIDAGLALVYGSSGKQGERGGFSDVDHQHHNVIGRDSLEMLGNVENRDCILVDDMIDSGSRITSAAVALKKHGARKVYAFASHGLFTGDAVERIENSPLTEVVVFNTVPCDLASDSPRVRELTVSSLVADAIMRIHNRDSVSALYGRDEPDVAAAAGGSGGGSEQQQQHSERPLVEG